MKKICTQRILNETVYASHALGIKNVCQKYLCLANGLGVPSAVTPTIYSEKKIRVCTEVNLTPSGEQQWTNRDKLHSGHSLHSQCPTMAPSFWWWSRYIKYFGNSWKIYPVYNRNFPKMLPRNREPDLVSDRRIPLWGQGVLPMKLFQGNLLLVKTEKRSLWTRGSYLFLRVVEGLNEIMQVGKGSINYPYKVKIWTPRGQAPYPNYLVSPELG